MVLDSCAAGLVAVGFGPREPSCWDNANGHVVIMWVLVHKVSIEVERVDVGWVFRESFCEKPVMDMNQRCM